MHPEPDTSVSMFCFVGPSFSATPYNLISETTGHLSTADADSVTIEWNDFKRALSEVRPAFGADDAALKACCPGGMIDFGPRYSTLRAELGRFFAQVEA
jgi:hypothetical protein